MGTSGERPTIVQFIIPDVETTGRRTYNSRIVEVAAIVLDHNLAEIERFTTLVNPGPEALSLAQPKAMEVHKLTADDLKGAPSTENAAIAFQTLLARYPEGVLQAFNNDFDSWFLQQSPWNVPLSRWGECIMKASMDYMDDEGVLELRYNGQAKFPKLSEAAGYFGIQSRPTHRAIDDAQVTADILRAIIGRRRSRSNDVDFLREAKYVIDEGY